MTSPHTIQRSGRADWALMTTIHAALRRDLDELLHTTASHTAAFERWRLFRDQLRLHLAAEQAAVWPLARAKLTGDPSDRALTDAMEDEHQLIGPLLAVTDDAFTMDTDPVRLRQLLARLATRLGSHLAHEEADALPLLGQIMSQRELRQITTAIRGGRGPPPRGAHPPVGARPRQPPPLRPRPQPAASTRPPAVPPSLAPALHPYHPAGVTSTRARHPRQCLKSTRSGLRSRGQ